MQLECHFMKQVPFAFWKGDFSKYISEDSLITVSLKIKSLSINELGKTKTHRHNKMILFTYTF